MRKRKRASRIVDFSFSRCMQITQLEARYVRLMGRYFHFVKYIYITNYERLTVDSNDN